MLGRNSLSGQRLHAILDELESIEEKKKDLAAQRAAVLAQAKTEGFHKKQIVHVLRQRAKSAEERQEQRDLNDLYEHAAGLAEDLPLFRTLGALAGSELGRERLLAQMLELVPAGGEMIISFGGGPVRLWRDGTGKAHQEDYVPPRSPPPIHQHDPDIDPPLFPDLGAPAAEGVTSGDGPPPVADPSIEAAWAHTPEEAEAMGRQAAMDGKAVTDNPFRHDDERRAHWDAGWREASGSDGMGA